MPRKILLCVGVLFLCFSAYHQFVVIDAGNRGLLIYTAQKWLEGRRLYIDLFEINPPLIVWLYSVPVFLAVHVPVLAAQQMLILFGGALLALSLWLCMRLLSYDPYFAPGTKERTEFICLFCFIYLFWILPGYFFDREEFFLVLTFPFILRWRPASVPIAFPAWLRMSVAVMAAVGFAVKPQSLLLLGGVLLITLLRERSLKIVMRMEAWIVAFLLGAYILSIFLLYPDYVHIIVPMALATYSAAGAPLFTTLTAAFLAGFTFLLTFAGFRFRQTSPFRRDIVYFLQVAVFSLLYALTNNGWDYAYIPLLTQLLFLTGWVLWELRYLRAGALDAVSRRSYITGMAACGAVLCFNFYFALPGWGQVSSSKNCGLDARCEGQWSIADDMKKHNVRRFGEFSSEFGSWVYLTQLTGADFVTRFNYLWMLPKFAMSPPAFTQKNGWIINYVGDGAAADMKQYRPQMMIIDTSPKFFNTGRFVSLPDMLARSQAFKAEWAHYRFDRTLNRCSGKYQSGLNARGCSFDIYYRMAENAQ